MKEETLKAIDEAMPEIIMVIKINQRDLANIFTKKNISDAEKAKIKEIVVSGINDESTIYTIQKEYGCTLKDALLTYLGYEMVPCYDEFRPLVECPPWAVMGISKADYLDGSPHLADEYADFPEFGDYELDDEVENMVVLDECE